MRKKKAGNVRYLAFNNLCQYKNLISFVSTRDSGDMAYKEANPSEYLINRRRFLEGFDIDLENTVFCEQIHKNRIEIVNNDFFRNKNSENFVMSGADGLITATPGICLAIRTSDCVPLIIYDPIKNVLGVVHAGWRGTLLQISRQAIEKINKVYGSDYKDLICCIGPSIGPQDYLVRKDVQKQFVASGYGKYLKYVSNDQWLLDLWGINFDQISSLGVMKKNIEISGISTFSSGQLFSYRKKDPEGHFITGGMLK